jgi:MEMO1 family protein
MSKFRKSSCAGSWYDDNPIALKKEINKYLENVKNENFNVKAVIAPHAGYMYSGQVAAYSFRQLKKNTRKVIILGTAHRYPLKGACVMDYDFYETPFGTVKLCACIPEILKEKNFSEVPEADDNEHSIEIEIPFLQQVLDEYCLIPIIVGSVDTDYFAGMLEKYYDDDTVIVASVDLSHFHKYDSAVKLDEYSIDSILTLNHNNIKSAEIDSPYAIMSLLKLAKKKKWKAKLLCYKNSGDITSDKRSVVGYASIIFYEQENKFSHDDREYLENLAKTAVENYVKEGKTISVKEAPENLKEKLACFVTIYKKGDLRGCIGTILPVDKLYKSVIDNAISAATRDSRFNPVTSDELEYLNYEISILSSPKEIYYNSEEDLFKKINGKGVILEKGFYKATYLPQVWEHFKTESEFLSSLCRKAGLNGNEWDNFKDSKIRISVYETYE